MSGITFSLGRAAPAAFSPKVNKKLYQGFNGGGASGFRGYHDMSQSILDQAIKKELAQTAPSAADGVLLIDPKNLFYPPDQPPPEEPSPSLTSIGESLGLPPGLKLASIARIALMGVGGARLGGVVGMALLALTIPDLLILYRDATGGVAEPTKGTIIPLNGYSRLRSYSR